MTARYIIGDVFEALASLPDNSVDLVFSSPPFLALRSYLPADHPLKSKEIGSEATPADFLDTLLDVVEACDRVLAPHGSLCFELGDTFAGSGGAGGDYNEGGVRDGQEKFSGSASRGDPPAAVIEADPEWFDNETRAKERSRSGWHRLGQRATPGADHYGNDYRKDGTSTDSGSPGGGYGWPLPKSLSGIPTLFAWSLAYGRNLLRPERTTPRWRIRNVVIWARPNPPVGALGDKFRPATSYLTVACKSDKRWFDLDAVRTESIDTRPRSTNGPKNAAADVDEVLGHYDTRTTNPAGAPPLDYWEIPTQPYPGSHYATFPDKLVVKPVKAMCPSSVCRTCGEPRRRLTDVSYDSTDPSAWGGRAEWTTPRPDAAQQQASRADAKAADAGVNPTAQSFAHGRAAKVVTTTGWTDCGHDDYRAGMCLDPFAGSGTTLSVATGHGRDAIGIDLDPRNAELALERVGPLFLEVEHLADTQPFSPPAEDVETEIV